MLISNTAGNIQACLDRLFDSTIEIGSVGRTQETRRRTIHISRLFQIQGLLPTGDNYQHIGGLNETEELLNPFTASNNRNRIIIPMLTACGMISLWAVGAVGALYC